MRVKADALIKEMERRKAVPKLLSACFDKQVDFIKDPSRRKALFVARRSGKTWTVAVLLIMECLLEPATKCLYFGLTSESSWNTIYLHMIEVLCRQFAIDIEVNLTQKTITFGNKSYIKITGADANDKQIDKALGGKYRIVVFDECQSINHDLENWINNKLAPAMVDLDGTIVMAGTAGDLMGERFWYRVTKTDGVREPGWKVHSWTPFDNPYMAEKVQKHLDQLKATNNKIEETPGYQQQWLCQWVVETDSRIYKYNSIKNSLTDKEIIESLMRPDSKWKCIFGMDYGFEDDTALVVGAFHIHDPHCYLIDSVKKPKMLTQEIAELIIKWKHIYNPVYIVGDAQNKTLIETLRMQYRIPITPAKKLGKEAHIAAMNSDFITGKIQVIEANNRALIAEWNELTWLETKRVLGIYQENPSKDNHLADAALYLHHFSKHYRAIPEPKKEESTMREQAERQLKESFTNASEQAGLSIYEHMDIATFLQGHK